VSSASLTGTIRNSFSDLTALTYLDLSFNTGLKKLPYFGNLAKLV
jgi:hypothetical protein